MMSWAWRQSWRWGGSLVLVFILSTFQVTHSQATVDKEQSPLVFGLLPSESAMTKIRRYAPLRDYLSERLGRQVILETASNFKQFVLRTEKRHYDFLETAPHFVPPAIEQGKYQVITTITRPLTAVVVVHKDNTYTRIQQLAGGDIATPSHKAIITKIGKAYLAKQGLRDSKAPKYENYPTHNAAYEAVLGGLKDAAIISVNVYRKALKQNRQLKMLGESEPIPNMSILVANDIDHVLQEHLQLTLVSMRRNEEGRKVLVHMAYPGYRKATAEEFDVLKPYLKKQAK